MKKGIIILLLISLVIRLVLFFQPHPVMWDSSVYLGMGRELYSDYQIGIWEPLRPILWPLTLGLFWKLGLNEIIFGNILQVLLSLGIIYLVYSISYNYSKSENEALIAAALISFTPVFVTFTFKLYTEIPAVFLSLLSLKLIQKYKSFSSGFTAGLAFLTKFPAGLILIGNSLSISFKDFKKIILSFFIAVIPYFIYNQIRYGDFLLPIKEGKYVIKYAGIWIFQQPWDFYLKEFLVQNLFYAFAIIGIFMLLRKKTAAVPAAGLALLLYFSLEPHKEARFMILFLPYFAIMAAYGISKLKIKYAPIIIGIVSFAMLLPFLGAEPELPDAIREYRNFGMDSYKSGEVLSSTPSLALAEITQITPVYYSIYDTNLSQTWENYILKNQDNISYIFLDTCEGGILCPPWDSSCQEARESLMNTSKIVMPSHKVITRGSCEYHIFYR